MIAQPRFKRSLRCEVVAPEGLFVLSDAEQVFLHGSVFCALAPLLDGERTVAAIFAALTESFAPPEIFAALDQLRRSGFLADGVAADDGAHRGADCFWETLDVAPAEARARLDATAVSVVGCVGLDGAPLTALLRSAGARVEPRHGEGRGSTLRVVLAADYLDPELDRENARALAEGQPWLLVKPLGVEVWLGPLFVPDRTGCWVCLSHRLAALRKVEGYLRRHHGTSDPFTPPLAALPSTEQAAFALVATEVVKWIVLGRSPTLEGKVISLSMLTLERDEHVLTRRPQCRSCGRPDGADPRSPLPVVMVARPKRFTADGGHRAATPEEVWERLRPQVSPITGVVGSVRRMSGAAGDEVTPAYVAEHGFLGPHADLAFFREGLRRRAGGKGVSHAQARVSALGEAIERCSGVFQGDEPRLRAARAELGAAAVHPNACMGYSERQYRERDAWNARGAKVYRVPEPLDEGEVIPWSPLWSLTSREPRYLPTAYCYYGAPEAEGGRYAIADSNGCAAGSTLEEAVLQGLLELVERDAVAVWWYNRVTRPGVDLASFDDADVARIQDRHRALGRELWALDLRHDLGIPVLAAVSRRVSGPAEDILLGFGAHLDAHTALLRALTEVSQSLPAVPSPDGARRYAAPSAEALRWFRTATIEGEPYLLAGPEPPRARAAYPRLASDDLGADVGFCVQTLANRGVEVLVLDQTRPDVGLHVVRVVAPGLRHFWARFGPGRLYDVPVASGWLRAPRTEDELNPWVVYF